MFDYNVEERANDFVAAAIAQVTSNIVATGRSSLEQLIMLRSN